MIVVADTTPLRYLVFIEEEQVLERIFGRVYVPPEVLRVELQVERRRNIVRSWAHLLRQGSSSKPRRISTRPCRRGCTRGRSKPSRRSRRAVRLPESAAGLEEPPGPHRRRGPDSNLLRWHADTGPPARDARGRDHIKGQWTRITMGTERVPRSCSQVRPRRIRSRFASRSRGLFRLRVSHHR